MSLAFEFLARIAHTGLDRTAALRLLKTKIAKQSQLWDYFIRLQMLEGAAEKPFGTWYQAGKRGFDLAKAHFEDQGVELHPDWLSTDDKGIYKLALKGAKNVFKGEQGPMGQDADALVTDAIMGISSLTGDRIDPMFYAIGRRNKKEITTRESGPKNYRSTIAYLTQRKAIDEIRKYKTHLDIVERPHMEEHRYDEGERKPDMVYMGPGDGYVTSEEFLLSALSGRGVPSELEKYAKAVRIWMDKQVDNTPGLSDKMGKPVVRLYLEKIRKGTQKGSLSEVAAEIGTSPSSVSHMVKKYMKHVQQTAKTDRRIQKMINEINLRHEAEFESRRRLASERLRIAALRVARLYREASRESYIPSSERKKAKPIKFPEDLPLEGWTWQIPSKDSRGNKITRYYLLAFKGRQSRPIEHWWTPRKERRKQAIDELISNARAAEDYKKKRREEKKNFEHALKVGDLLYASWGYDQTNVDYFEVTKVVGKTVEVREIGSKVVSEDGYSTKVAPAPGRYTGPKMKKRPQMSGKSCYVKIDKVRNAYPWDGTPMHETSPYAGH